MKRFFKFGCLGAIGLMVGLIIVVLILGDDLDGDKATKVSSNESPNEQSKEPTQKEETADSENEIKKVGEELGVGKVVFKVNSVEETDKITAGDGLFKYTPDAEGAVFLIVNVTVKNEDTEMIQTDSSFFKLKSENGADYSPSTIIAADDKFFTFEGINPGLALTGNVVFEVPSGLTGLDLQVQTGFWGTETGIINLN